MKYAYFVSAALLTFAGCDSASTSGTPSSHSVHDVGSKSLNSQTQGEALIPKNESTQSSREPNPDMKHLDRFVGTWKVSGGARGTASFEWMEGGFFLVQHVDLEQYGQKIKGIEIIGHVQEFGAEPSEDIRSRFYDNLGNTLDYVYELDGNALTIWGGKKGSPAHFQGTFSDDGNTVTGDWVYPGGGGYESTMTRVK